MIDRRFAGLFVAIDDIDRAGLGIVCLLNTSAWVIYAKVNRFAPRPMIRNLERIAANVGLGHRKHRAFAEHRNAAGTSLTLIVGITRLKIRASLWIQMVGVIPSSATPIGAGQPLHEMF